MASTRDKRMKTDSPTPAQVSETTTPTTKTSTAIKLKRMSRSRSGMLSSGKAENEDGNDSMGLSEDTQSSTQSAENVQKTPNTRPKRQLVKDEKEPETNGDSKEEEEVKESVTDSPSRRVTKSQSLKNKAAAELANAAKRRAMLKRTSLPLPMKSSLRNLSKRQSTGAKLPETNAGTLKKTKVVTRKAAEKEEEAIEPEVEKKTEEVAETEVTIKQEKVDKSATSDAQNVRRSTRQRKSTIKDRDSPFTRRSQARDKSESKRDSVSPALSTASVKTEKDSAKAISITVEPSESADKDPSLSPELISEELDTESVQHLYDKPDFLENNLGIEKDPKLGEIVKVKETAIIKDEEVVKEEEQVEIKKDAEIETNVEDKEEEEINKSNEQVNGEKMSVDEPIETKQTENSKEKEEEDVKIESVEIKEQKEEKSAENEEIKKESDDVVKEDEKQTKVEDSSEENKENNVESSPKAIGGNSPRSEEKLKIVIDGNTPKIDLNESAELLKLKISHFKSLGLLTHKAADEAKLAKIKRKEELAIQAAQQLASRKAKKDSSHDQNRDSSGTSKTSGTLKTIIKLNRNDKEKRKTRMPLKITFQKKNRDKDSNGSSNSAENSFYTIQNERDTSSSESHGATIRKSHNRSYNHDQVATSNDQNKHEPVVNKELDQSLVIPEKASSFKVHPERICKDQCFYCGGKFGLYDTPCHIAQIKSLERQQKILETEEKLTKDSCLCDACFRHVDRRANCPSYKSKQRMTTTPHYHSPPHHNQNNVDRTLGMCCVVDCNENAVHSIRKKWLIKMRKTISKIFQVNMDLQPTNANVAVCEEHSAALSHIMVCAMCKRKLPRNHIFYITQDLARLEHLISEQGLHVKLVNSTLVVCKLCSYYNNLLIKPPEPKTQKADFVRNYTKKLMKHNSMENEYANRHIVSVDDDDVQEVPIRNDELTLTIKNGKIQPKKPQDRFHNSKEVTITTMKSSPAPGGHIMLDNDVMVGYDVPLMDCPSPPAHAIKNPHYKGPSQTSPKVNKSSETRKSKDIIDNNEMARVLKSNPNISMRELFPGEDEMALQINLPFNSGSTQRTPEGWAKVQMTIQYDDVTKALWEHLQRPYGNQSSFIRHLVLLEKYYRNGDLVLSQSASNSAVTYSESVRNRLRSYDNIPSKSTNTSSNAPNFSNEITIIPTSKSRNKSNDSLTITPQPAQPSLLKRKASQPDTASPKTKVSKVDEPAPKKTSPPELISFTQKPSTRNSSVAAAAVNKDKESTSSQSSSVSITPTTSTATTTPTQQSGSSGSNGNSNNVIVLPDTLTPQERKQCTKSWRPTLIPITGSAQLLNSNGPLYQTADGRKLPELVQVMSGGKPYHISIHDYNKMCIIRREKLQQQLNQKARQHAQSVNANASGSGSPNGNVATSVANTPPASTNSLSIIPMPKEKEGSFKPAVSSAPSNISKLANIPNQILEQNSLIPLDQNGKRHQNGSAGNVPPLTSAFQKNNSNSNMMSMLPPALTALSKTVNALQPTSSQAAQIAAWNSLWGDNEININSDNMAALASIANLASLGTVGLIDSSAASLLSKIPKSLTVIPQAKNDRRSSDEQKNSAST